MLTSFDMRVLEEIEFMNDSEFSPSVAALADPLNTDAPTIEMSVDRLQKKGYITGRERKSITPRGQNALMRATSSGVTINVRPENVVSLPRRG